MQPARRTRVPSPLPRNERWNQLLLSHPGLPALRRAERALSRKKRFVYRDAGKIRVIDLKLRPRLMGHAQLAYLSRVAEQMARLQHTVARAWLDDPRLRRALPVSEAEARLLEPILRSPAAHRAPVVSRLDASVAFGEPGWKEKLRIFELNSVGVGGLALTPIAAEVVQQLVAPHLDHPGLARGPDPRDALTRLLQSHARALGLRRPVVGLIEERDSDSGVAEYDDLAAHFRSRRLASRIGDVRELQLKDGRLLLRGSPVDLLYRDVEVQDLVTMRGAAAAREALQWAFSQGRVLSGIAGDFDHKSLLEVVTDEAFDALLTQGQRRYLRPHALWTRLVYPRRTTDERGARVDLERHLSRHREHYVLKPNRAYGGVGVTVGVDTSAAEWSKALSRAFERPNTWVCQQLGEVMREDFPVVREDGTVELQPHFVDCGVYRVGDTFSILSRAAYRRVVNVSSGGGLSAVLFA